MNNKIKKWLRTLYIGTSSLTHGFQDKNPSKQKLFYKLWSPLYDISVGIDPAYRTHLKEMVEAVVSPDDTTLDIGCGTGIGTIYAANIARMVIALDPSRDMINKLKKKIAKSNIDNIEIREGYFPESLQAGESFDSIISSFMLAHLNASQRKEAIASMFSALKSQGRIGLFSAQGEIASTFQTKEEITNNLSSAGFKNIIIKEVADIYRIATAVKN